MGLCPTVELWVGFRSIHIEEHEEELISSRFECFEGGEEVDGFGIIVDRFDWDANPMQYDPKLWEFPINEAKEKLARFRDEEGLDLPIDVWFTVSYC